MVERGVLIRCNIDSGEAEKDAIYEVYSSKEDGSVNVDKGGGWWIYNLKPEDYTVLTTDEVSKWAIAKLGNVLPELVSLTEDSAVRGMLTDRQIASVMLARSAVMSAINELGKEG